MNSFMVRSALVVVALLATAWLALGVRASALESDARAVTERARAGPVPPAEVNAALDDLAEAARLSPDQGPLISQGELLYAAERGDEARAVAKRVTKSEPDNLEAWFLAWAVAGPERAAKARAQERLVELNPWFEFALRRR